MIMRRFGLLVVGALGLVSGCAQLSLPGQPTRQVTFTYGYGDVPVRVRTAIVTELRQGTIQLTDRPIGGEIGCVATDTASTKFKLHGRWGDPGANSSLEASGFSMDQLVPSPPAPVCEMTPGNIPAALTILAGGGSDGLQVGQPDLSATVNIAIGKTLYTASNSYAKFVVDSVNPLTHFTTGRFEFLGIDNRNPYDSRVLVVSGTFAVYGE